MSKETVIRDRGSNCVGSIVDNGQQLVAGDKFGRNLGYYDKRRNRFSSQWPISTAVEAGFEDETGSAEPGPWRYDSNLR